MFYVSFHHMDFLVYCFCDIHIFILTKLLFLSWYLLCFFFTSTLNFLFHLSEYHFCLSTKSSEWKSKIPVCWWHFHYLTRWSLQTFINHINSHRSNMQFTTELEDNNFLHFLDVVITRLPNGHLGNSVYRKTDTHWQDLNANSHHHPT